MPISSNIGKKLRAVPFDGNPPPPGQAYLMPTLSVRPTLPEYKNVNPFPDGRMPTRKELAEQRHIKDVRGMQFRPEPRHPEPGLDTVRHYLEVIPASVPNEHILFGAAHVRVTVGDLRLITGIGCDDE